MCALRRASGRAKASLGAKQQRRARSDGVMVASTRWSYLGEVRAHSGQRKVARLRRSGRTAHVRWTARRSTARSRGRSTVAPGRDAAAPGRLLRRPAHGGGGPAGGDSRVGEVVVFWAHRTAVSVGPAPGRRKVARLRRSGRTARVRKTARRGTALSQRRYKIAPGREVAAPGRQLRRPAHGGGGDSRVGEVVVFGAHRPARTAARVGPVPGRRKFARLRRSGLTAHVRWTARRSAAVSRRRYKINPGRGAAAPGRARRAPAHGGGGGNGIMEGVGLWAPPPPPPPAPRGPAPGRRSL